MAALLLMDNVDGAGKSNAAVAGEMRERTYEAHLYAAHAWTQEALNPNHHLQPF